MLSRRGVESAREPGLRGEASLADRRGSPCPGPVERFSALAGALTDPESEGPYRVRYQSLRTRHEHPLRPVVFALLNMGFELIFLVWLVWPNHYLQRPRSGVALVAEDFVIATIALMELLRLINVVSFSVASVVARDPIPVRPRPGMKVAFLTTMVPGTEPIETVRATLRAALKIKYHGVLDVWLLDEGDDPDVAHMCSRLGVNHFSRKGKGQYNQPSGPFKARTKHGNYNAWLDQVGDGYELAMSVDPDHVPLSSYAERLLGYFRDPDIAFVVAPQNYANTADGFVTMAAESQQFPFHSVIQRAGNRYGCAMLVGTNNAFRVAALQAVGGFEDSITEDLATGLKIHTSRRNLRADRTWRSVYTPDVVAVGEGPAMWGDYFSQQARWSRGTFELLLRSFWRRAPLLAPGQLLHYGLITTFYPSMALGWILGAVNALLFALMGATGISVPPQLWLALYVDATAFQLWLYFWNRRYNVSPFETEGSFGIAGMLMSALASPIFANSLIRTLLRRPARFVVTPKGSSSTADQLYTFRWHAAWAGLFATTLLASVLTGYATLVSSLWPATSLVIALAPVLMWGSGLRHRDGAVEGATLADELNPPNYHRDDRNLEAS